MAIMATRSHPATAVRYWLPAIALACAVAAPVRAETEAASEPFALRPWGGAAAGQRQDPESGAIALLGASLRELVARAWDVHPNDVRSTGPDLAERFDVVLRPSAERDGAALLQASLPPTLGFQAEIRELTVKVFELRLAQGARPLEPSTAPEPGALHRPGSFRATRLPASALVEFARQQLGRPVFDATGLEDRYDWLLQWDPLGEKREILIAFGDLGFELAPVERPVRFLVITPAPKAAPTP
jgi:uncharacterized protein (TIGR03435 family)